MMYEVVMIHSSKGNDTHAYIEDLPDSYWVYVNNNNTIDACLHCIGG